jgi:hypothetical protein
MAVRSRFCGKGDGGEEHLVLGLELGQGLVVIAESLRAGARTWRRDGHWFTARVQEQASARGGVQVAPSSPASKTR